MHTKTTVFVIVASFLVCSCSVTEQKLAGVYKLKGGSRTQLVLKRDKTFEFVKNFSEPGPVFLPDSTEMNFRTAGNWVLDNKKQVVLNSFGNGKNAIPVREKDSIIANTTITSFSFWNSYGDPVSIRFMKFPTDKIKLYKANTISFFSGDFGKTDTLEFHFYGYAPIKWPGQFHQMADNASHRVTLFEEERPGYFSQLTLSTKGKKLISSDKSFALYKTK
jgi:hypothetical protein